MSSPLFFERFEEERNTMIVYYRDEHGTLGALTFGDRYSAAEYRIVGVSQGGRDYDGAPDPTVFFMLHQRGVTGQRVLNYVDDPTSGIEVSHTVSVTAPKERAYALSHATGLFMNGTAWTLEHLYRVPKLTAISYEDDAFIISFDLYGTLKLGMTTSHRRWLTRYDRTFFEAEPGFTAMTFWFTDEKGQELHQKFLVVSEQIDQLARELNLYVMAFEAQHHPKAEAATVGRWQLAA